MIRWPRTYIHCWPNWSGHVNKLTPLPGGVSGKHTSVADDPETLRIRKNTNQISNVAYHGEISRREQMENARPTEIES